MTGLAIILGLLIGLGLYILVSKFQKTDPYMDATCTRKKGVLM